VALALAFSAVSLVACTKDPAPIAPDGSGTAAEKPGTQPGANVEVTTPQNPTPQPTAATPTQPTATTVATTTPSGTATPMPVATTMPPTPTPQPDRPMMARYGVAPNFR
jgi:hypothetical protein